MPRNKSEIDPARAPIMAYARACEACLSYVGPAHRVAVALNQKREKCYAAIPEEEKGGLGWGASGNLQTIIQRYGAIDAA